MLFNKLRYVIIPLVGMDPHWVAAGIRHLQEIQVSAIVNLTQYSYHSLDGETGSQAVTRMMIFRFNNFDQLL